MVALSVTRSLDQAISGLRLKNATDVTDAHLLRVVNAVDFKAALVDEVVDTRVTLHQQLLCKQAIT